METDQKVQQTIRREFSKSTVIMIAHRLQTVIDCDKIIVMKNGCIVEVGHPFELLTKYFTYNNDELQREYQVYRQNHPESENKEDDNATSSTSTVANKKQVVFSSKSYENLVNMVKNDSSANSGIEIVGDDSEVYRDSFASMVHETGESMSRYLLKKSSESFHILKSSSSDSCHSLHSLVE